MLDALEVICRDPTPGVSVQRDVAASRVTTFALGGTIRALFEPNSIAALCNLLVSLREQKLPWRVLGAGSNVVIGDQGLDVPLLRLGKGFSKFEILDSPALDLECPNAGPVSSDTSAAFVLAFAGTPLMSLSRKLSLSGLTGLEFAAGIPASLGGAVKMNAGAHGGQMSDLVHRLWIVDQDGILQERTAEQLEFSYRHSSVNEGEIVVAAELELAVGDPDQISQRRTECLEYRKRTQPLHLPSAGSVFRNPSRTTTGLATVEGALPAAAALLDSLGFRGKQSGGVQFSEMHANWLVKVSPDAQAVDVVRLIEEAVASVQERYAVLLKPEIVLW